ncbi:MAG: hypothetical protein GWN71_34440, partial [Gammaproteobacteria bacterium]|nr:hypothetical protein [Gemmatimonadota bacterium]NIU78476.1 hypothetical protein [Gammaproteobacteria bacterium]
FVLPLLFLHQVPGLAAQEPRVNTPGLGLREAFDVYVQAVQAGDLDGLFTTVTEGDELFFVTASGE